MKKSADQGNTSAQINLGVMYAKGEGVEKNILAAYQLWSEVAAQNNPVAQANLERLCIENSWVCNFQSRETSQ